MQVEITYDDGKLAFVSPIQLKQKHLRLTIDILDEDTVVPSSTSGTSKSLEPRYKLPSEILRLAQEAEAKLDRVRMHHC
jgi:hypothetical protein